MVGHDYSVGCWESVSNNKGAARHWVAAVGSDSGLVPLVGDLAMHNNRRHSDGFSLRLCLHYKAALAAGVISALPQSPLLADNSPPATAPGSTPPINRGRPQAPQNTATNRDARQTTTPLSPTPPHDQPQTHSTAARFPGQASGGRRRTLERGRSAYRAAGITVRRSRRPRPLPLIPAGGR